MEEEKKKHEDVKPEEKAFKPIETQEEFDELIKARLERQSNKIRKETSSEIEKLKLELEKAKELDNNDSKWNTLIETAKSENDSLRAENEQLKIREVKRNALISLGLPENLIDNISGTDEEDIKKKAEALAESLYNNGFRKKQFGAPAYNPEAKQTINSYDDYLNIGWKKIANDLFSDM